MKYHVCGMYEMKFFVEVDEMVNAEDETEAIEKVQDEISAGEAYDQECEWFDGGPKVTKGKGG